MNNNNNKTVTHSTNKWSKLLDSNPIVDNNSIVVFNRLALSQGWQKNYVYYILNMGNKYL